MLPLHAGHPGHESALIVAVGVVAIAVASAVTQKRWGRVAALGTVGALAALVRVGGELVGLPAGRLLHVVTHGLEIGAFVAIGIACAYAVSLRFPWFPGTVRHE